MLGVLKLVYNKIVRYSVLKDNGDLDVLKKRTRIHYRLYFHYLKGLYVTLFQVDFSLWIGRLDSHLYPLNTSIYVTLASGIMTISFIHSGLGSI